MIKPVVGGPLILLVDYSPGRIEYYEYFFFQNGYLVRAATLEDLEENDTMDNVKLVLSFLPLEPEKITERDIPVIFVIPDDSTADENADPDNPLVAYLPASTSSDTLFDKITGLISA